MTSIRLEEISHSMVSLLLTWTIICSAVSPVILERFGLAPQWSKNLVTSESGNEHTSLKDKLIK